MRPAFARRRQQINPRNARLRAALDRLQKELENEKLIMSADLYAEMYEEDKELRKLTESAISEWPE